MAASGYNRGWIMSERPIAEMLAGAAAVALGAAAAGVPLVSTLVASVVGAVVIVAINAAAPTKDH
jgi:hypothetical protein